MTMSKLPPVPEHQRSHKGAGSDPILETDNEIKQDPGAPGGAHPRNLIQQGQQGNTRQNTTHQGYQQDR
jgi:hypothetical protein